MATLSEVIKTLIGVEIQTEDLEELREHPEKYVQTEDLEKVNQLLKLLDLTQKITESKGTEND